MSLTNGQRKCPDLPLTSRRLGLREEDLLPAAEGRLLALHLASCADCRVRALEADTTLLFAPLGLEDGPAAGSGNITADCLAAVDFSRSKSRFQGKRRRAIAWQAAAAASFLFLLAGTWGVWLRGERVELSAGPTAPAARPAGPVEPEPRGHPPLLEEIAAPGAKVYQFAASRPGEPTVIFVVDQSADI